MLKVTLWSITGLTLDSRQVDTKPVVNLTEGLGTPLTLLPLSAVPSG